MNENWVPIVFFVCAIFIVASMSTCSVMRNRDDNQLKLECVKSGKAPDECARLWRATS
jgi:hypothetical protein